MSNQLYRSGARLGGVLLGLAVLATMLAPAVPAAAQTGANTAGVQQAGAWIAGQQQADGSFPGFGVGSTADAIFGLVAAGRPGLQRAASGTSDIDFLAGKAASYAKTPGAAAKLVLAVQAAGSGDIHHFGGVDLLAVVNGGYDTGSGHYGRDVTGQALVLLALAALGQPVPPAAVNWLASAQGPDGGWAFDGSTKPGAADTNTTGLALQALAAVKAGSGPAVQKALAYLHAQQNADGGFAYQKGPGNDSDANSTAMVIMGLLAAGEDPAGAAWAPGGKNPLTFLRSLQNPGGALGYQAAQPADNAGATYQAVPALAGRTLPLAAAAAGVPATPAPTTPAGGPAGGGTAPGMPTTGAGDGFAWPLAALLAAGGLLLAGRRLGRAR